MVEFSVCWRKNTCKGIKILVYKKMTIDLKSHRDDILQRFQLFGIPFFLNPLRFIPRLPSEQHY